MTEKTEIRVPQTAATAYAANSRFRYAFSMGAIIAGVYEVLKPLGHGGMGEVYLCRHCILDVRRAVKVIIPADSAQEQRVAQKALSEARTASMLRHKHIVDVMDVLYDEKRHLCFIVMEYMDGGTLRQMLRTGEKLTEQRAMAIAMDVAEALAYAEKLHIVHRDIKPDNIMLSSDGTVKVADLGIARPDEQREDDGRRLSGRVVGTPAFIPPEQIRHPNAVDCRADIYSLGISLYEMLTNEKPYRGRTTEEILQRVLKAPVPDVRILAPQISRETAMLLKRMMAKDPDDRPGSWQEVTGRIQAILKGTHAHKKSWWKRLWELLRTP